MDLIEMYPAAVNSKVTVTLGVLNADSTIIEVLDGSVLPDAPNLLVLGADQTAETIKMTAKDGNTLTVERGIQGTAIAWPAGTQVARNFTAKDWDDMITNLNTMKTIIEADIAALNSFKGIAYTTSNKPSASDVGAPTTTAFNSHLNNKSNPHVVTADQLGVVPIWGNAGYHNSIYRGKYLGSAVTDAQWAAISAGTFEDLYIGDYWTIGGINYRIAAFDYYYKTGDTSCTTHHVVIVPDVNMYTHVMNDTNITTGAYVGSKMYTEGLESAKTTITNAFGSAHILSHRQYLQNAVSGDTPSGGAWYDSTVELMTEQNVYGCKIFGACVNGTTWPNNYTVDKSQYPLFTFRPDMISNRQWFWLRDVENASDFALVDTYGSANGTSASLASGVRPAFSIC